MDERGCTPITKPSEEIYESQTHITELPIEIIFKIMTYLPHEDRLSASQVCKVWCEASRYRSLCKNDLLLVKHSLIRPMKWIEKSEKVFFHFQFYNVDFQQYRYKQCIRFWNTVCRNMRSLTLQKCYLSGKILHDMLLHSSNLECLTIDMCSSLLQRGSVWTESECLVLREKFANLRSLKFVRCQVSNKHFSRFVAIAPNLEELVLEVYNITFDTQYYAAADAGQIQYLAWSTVANYIKSQASQLKSLKISEYKLDNDSFQEVISLDNLKLNELHLTFGRVNFFGFRLLANLQKSLTHLSLRRCTHLSDSSLKIICQNLTDLRTLDIEHSRHVTEEGVADISHLTKLESLNLAKCNNVKSRGIDMGVCRRYRPSLRQLSVSHININEETVCKIAENLPFLRYLNLTFCFKAVTNKSMQAICRYLIRLETLEITSSSRLGNEGIGGYTQILNKNVPNSGNKYRKVAKPCQIFGIDRLKRLLHLTLFGYKKLTDLTCQHLFKFQCLRHLDLTKCVKITYEGFEAIALNNPSINTLILCGCRQVNDDIIKCIVRNVKRLKCLKIDGCFAVTDESLNALQECRTLQFLSVLNCPKLSTEAVVKFVTTAPGIRIVYHTRNWYSQSSFLFVD